MFIFQNSDIDQNVFQSRLISQGRFFRLDFEILTKNLNNSSPCCPSRSRISNTIHSSIYQSSDSLLTVSCVQFLLAEFLCTAKANNVQPQMGHLSIWQRFPDQSNLVSNTEMHLMIYLERDLLLITYFWNSYISESTALKRLVPCHIRDKVLVSQKKQAMSYHHWTLEHGT